MDERQIPRRAWLPALLAAGVAIALGSAMVALAQFDDEAAIESGLEAPLGITPAPEPCSGEPPADGPCPDCTTNVPGASAYQNSLPVPTPLEGYNYVVQLVNESNVRLLAGANAAHRGSSTVGGAIPTPITVLPREGTWVMQPKGAPNNGNILTIDIPPGWEGTQCSQSNPDCGANGPRFFARTGCKYDIPHNLAQCETGSCGDAYDCGKQALRVPPLASAGRAPLSIVEWTFNAQGAQGYTYPDISLVDGVNLTVDVQAIGPHCASKPGVPGEPNWLSQNQPLSIHGTDLRESGRCIPSFRLTRGEIGQLVQGQGNPDDVVACFTNCGRYEYPQTPGFGCDPETNPRCKAWLAFCCYAPAGDPDHIYGGPCTDNHQCRQQAACWDRGDGGPSICSCRAYIKNETCAPEVCTHPYTSTNKSAQPPFGHCTDVTGDPTACIGDDTVHAVFPGGYTWPNDPQTYVSDARAYRIIFSPGGTSVPITDTSDVPMCSSLPAAYGYDVQVQICKGVIDKGVIFGSAALSPACETTDDCPFIPGSQPPTRSSCDPLHKRCSTWSCETNDGGPVATGNLLCRWSADESASPSPTPTKTPGGLGGGAPTRTPAPGGSDSDDGCAVGAGGDSSGALLLALFAVALLAARRRA